MLKHNFIVTLLIIFSLNVFAQPANSECITAEGITLASDGTACSNGTTTLATGTTYTTHACNPTNQNINEVWYQYVTSGTQNTITVTPTGGNPISQPSITITDQPCGSTVSSTCDIAAGPGGSSQVQWTYPVGTTVWINVGAVSGDGDFEICIESINPNPGPGDDCANATILCDKSSFNVADMNGFSSSATFPSCFLSPVQLDAWFQFTVGTSGTLEFLVTPNAAVELDFAVYDITNGCGAFNRVELVCNYNYDASSGAPNGLDPSSCVTCPTGGGVGACGEVCQPINVVAGNTYAIMIDNYDISGNTGFQFDWGGTMEIAPVADYTLSNTSACVSNGPLNVTITDNSVVANSYSWDFGNGNTSTSPNPSAQTYTDPGSYLTSLVVTSATGCTDVHSIPVNIYSEPSLSTSTVTETCVGDCNGSVSVVVDSLGQAPFTYSWNTVPVQGTATASNICDGNYAVTVTDANNCQSTANVTLNPGPTCTVPCNMDSIIVYQGGCINDMFEVDATVYFSDPPSTGTMTITIDDGTTTYDTTFNAPFTSPYQWVTDIPTGGGAYTVTAAFSDDAACTISIGGTAPNNCGCSAYIGTFVTDVEGVPATDNITLCYGDTFTMTSNLDYTYPDDISDPDMPYNPGIGYFIYSCPPSVATTPSNTPPDDWIGNDPCLVGGPYYGNSISDFSNGTIGAPFNNSTAYFVPITFYNIDSNLYSYVNAGNLPCYSMGTPIAVQYLSEVVSSNPTENCQDSSFTITISGGFPEMNGSDYTASNLLPANAYFINNTATHNGTIQIGGLLNGDMYSFDVQDTNGCPITVSGGPFVGLPDANAGVDDTTCALAYNLAPVVSYGTGTWTGPGNITFTPNANDPNATATSTTPGTYTLTWTEDNGNGCTSTDDVDITYSDPSYTAVTGDALCGQATGSITITANDGIAPYQYSNDNGVNFQAVDSFTNLVAGPYNIVVEDAAGCQVTGVENINNFGAPTIDGFTLTDPLCNADCNGEIIVHATGGTLPYQFSVDGGAQQADSTFTAMCGATTYAFTVEDDMGCIVSRDTLLIDPDLLVLDSISSANVDCNGNGNGTINVYAQGGTGTLEYSIDNGATYGPVSNFTGLAPGTYYVWVQDDNNCTVNDSVVITEPLALSIPNLVDSVVCFGTATGQIQVLPQGGVAPYDIAWTSSANTGTVEPNLPAGAVTVTVTDDNNCTLDSTFTIYEPAQFTYGTDSQNANCNQPDGWAAVTGFSGGTGAYTYLWDLNAGNQNTDTAFNLVPGIYEVTITDENSCDTLISVVVGNNPSFTTSITNVVDVTCFGGNDGEATANGSDPLATYSYAWSTTPVQTTQTATGLVANTMYYVTITDDATGCLEYDSVMVIEPTAVVINSVSPDITICAGQTTDVTATAIGGSGAGYAYEWNQGIGAGQTHTVAPATGTSLTYEVWAQDGNGCPSDTGSVTVTVHPELSVSVSPDDTICPGFTSTLQASGSFGNGGPYTYSWTPQTNIDDPNSPSPVVTLSQATTYYVTVSDGCSPDVMDSVTVYIWDLPQPFASPDTLDVCMEPVQAFTFYNTTDASNGMLDTNSVIWNFGDGVIASQPWDTIEYTYNDPGTYTVTMTVSSIPQMGGCTVTDTVIPAVTVHENPIADFLEEPNPTTMFEPEVEFTDITEGAINQWEWYFSNLGTSSFSNPSFEFPDDTSGVYPVTMIVTDIYGCQSSIVKNVIVHGEFGVFVPNTFTPDGDNKNDLFGPEGFGVVDEDYSFKIFNRWGQKIFETHDLFEPWDGTYKGEIVQQDTYVWKLNFKDVNGEKHERYGHVNVIK